MTRKVGTPDQCFGERFLAGESGLQRKPVSLVDYLGGDSKGTAPCERVGCNYNYNFNMTPRVIILIPFFCKMARVLVPTERLRSPDSACAEITFYLGLWHGAVDVQNQ